MPGQPEILSVDKNSARLRWAAPKSDGGSDIINYRLEMRAAGAYRWDTVNPTKKVTDTSYVVPDLKEETDYEFRVSAENKAGSSMPSTASRSVKYGKLGCFYKHSWCIGFLFWLDFVVCNVLYISV